MILEKPADLGLVLWDLIPDQYKDEILESTRKKLTGEDLDPLETPTCFALRAKKEYSTPMPYPMPISLSEDIGVNILGQAAYTYLEPNRALSPLNKAIKYTEALQERVVKGKLWTNPEEATRRLRKLRNYLEKITQSPTTPSQPKPTHSKEEVQQEHYLQYSSTAIPERLIEEAIARNIEIIEKGLKLAGSQVHLPGTGRIDILAYDQQGTPVVIGVKSGTADDSTITQLLAYMSKIEEREKQRTKGNNSSRKLHKKTNTSNKTTPKHKTVKSYGKYCSKQGRRIVITSLVTESTIY